MTHVSPSQIDTALGCIRKWGYSRQRPRTQNKWSAFGDRVHRLREDWLTHGIPPDPSTPEGKCALAGLEHLPMPGPGSCMVEWSFDVWSDGERVSVDEQPWPWIEYTGRVDFLHGYEPGRVIVVGDHKTCGDLIRASEMRTRYASDPQHVIYPFMVSRLLDVPNVITQWEYLRRPEGKTPAACEQVVNLHAADTIAARFHAMHHGIAVQLVALAGVPPEQLPRNLRRCGDYGGCPYRNECHVGVSPLEIATAQLGG